MTDPATTEGHAELDAMAGDCSRRHAESGAQYPHEGCAYCALLDEHYRKHPPTEPTL